jgi:hypothetical protein
LGLSEEVHDFGVGGSGHNETVTQESPYVRYSIRCRIFNLLLEPKRWIP